MKTLTALCIAALLVAVTLMGVGAAVAQENNSVYQPNYYTCKFTWTPSGFRESCGPQEKNPTECPKGQVLVKMRSYGVSSARCVPVGFSVREE